MSFKVAIVGSRKYTNELKIKNLIFKLKEKYGRELVIVSGGQPQGADGFGKKWALYFGVQYVEYPPCHFEWNEWCIEPVHMYNKRYHVSNYFKRNKQVAEYCDILYAFIPEKHHSPGTESTIKYAEKAGKKVVRTS